MSFRVYCNFCERCGRYFMRLKKHGDKVCIDCYRGNQDLRWHYPEEEVKEFLSTANKELIVVKGKKVYKLNKPLNNEVEIEDD